MRKVEQREIVVGIDEFRKATCPDVLKSGGLGPCIAIGVYNPSDRSGYMLHEADPQTTNYLMEFLRTIEADYGGMDGLRVRVGGNSLSNADTIDRSLREYQKCNRIYVKNTLLNYFERRRIIFRRAPDDNNCELVLDLQKGSFDYDSVLDYKMSLR